MFVAANLSATLSAVVFTAPLTAWYFRIFVLVAPLSSLLAVPAAGWSFMAAFVTVLLGFVWLPLASLLGWISWVLVRYILWIANGMMSWRYHAVYFTNPYLIYWLLFCTRSLSAVPPRRTASGNTCWHRHCRC